MDELPRYRDGADVSAVTRVEIEVLENGEKVGYIDIGYFVGQPYRVELATPDGIDARVVRNTCDVELATPDGIDDLRSERERAEARIEVELDLRKAAYERIAQLEKRAETLREALRRLRDHHERSFSGNAEPHPVDAPCRILADIDRILAAGTEPT